MKTVITISVKNEYFISRLWPIISKMYQYKPSNFNLTLNTNEFTKKIILHADYELKQVGFLLSFFSKHKQILKRYNLKIENRNELTRDIMYYKRKVAKYFNFNASDLEKNTRKREIVQARQIAMFFSKNRTKNSLETIGQQIGGKDHATVLHSIKTVSNLIESDKKYALMIDEIERKL